MAPLASNATVLDPVRLANLLGDGRAGRSDVVIELIDLYLEEAARLVSALQEGLARGRRFELGRIAHALSGASRAVGAAELAAVAAAIEAWAASELPGETPVTAEDLALAYGRTRHAFEIERDR